MSRPTYTELAERRGWSPETVRAIRATVELIRDLDRGAAPRTYGAATTEEPANTGAPTWTAGRATVLSGVPDVHCPRRFATVRARCGIIENVMNTFRIIIG